VARVKRALEDREAIDESDPASMRRAVALVLARYPARFAEPAWARASSVQLPAELPAFVFRSLSPAPDLSVL
jgi:hypothetical protein